MINIWPFNKIRKLQDSLFALNQRCEMLITAERNTRAQLHQAWKQLHELNHARDHLIRLCKQRKTQLREAGITPVEAYDFREPEAIPLPQSETLIAVAVFLPDITLTQITTPDRLDTILSSSLPSNEDSFTDMMMSLTDQGQWKGGTPTLWEYTFTTEQEDIPIIALRISTSGGH